MRYDKLTRWLHAGIALGIVLQLLSSLVMEVPKPGDARSALASAVFEAHETVGIGVLALLLTRWLWQLSGHAANGLGQLFPWFSRQRRAAVLGELQRLARLRFKEIPESGALAGGVHGLGLVLAAAMALSGTVIFFGMGEDGTTPAAVAALKEVHSFLATFMWIYLIGHGAMAAVHQWLGHRTLSEMFRLR